MKPPGHHIEVVKFLRSKTDGEPKVISFTDNYGKRKIPIGIFGEKNKKIFSTIGAFDTFKKIPEGNFEFAAFGDLEWLPNAIVTSIYWLENREFDEWPLVCEDAVKQNVRSTYRHMAFIPSVYKLKISTGQNVQWLLGIPITDNEISISFEECLKRIKLIYPEWLFEHTL